MAYNRNANPYGIASSEITWNGFADGGRNTNPGTPAVKDKWWEKGAAAFAAEGIPRLFDNITSVKKEGKGSGKIGEYDAPAEHYGRIETAADKGRNYMADQAASLQKTKTEWLDMTKRSIREGDPSTTDWSDKKLTQYIFDNPGRFNIQRDDKDKSSYISKYAYKGSDTKPAQYAKSATRKYDGMSLADMNEATQFLNNKAETTASAFDKMRGQEGYGKDIYSSKMPTGTPEFLLPAIPKGAIRQRDMNTGPSQFDQYKYW